MIENKSSQMKKLIRDLKSNDSAENILIQKKSGEVDLSLINHYKLHDFIPNKWFDWERRVNADIMIIGQDWGPYIALKKYFADYEIEKNLSDFDYDKFLLKTFSSRTEKFIMHAIQEIYTKRYGTFDHKVFDDFFFTMSVLFTRQGKHFRGSHNFHESKSFEISYPFVKRQIEIVKPKLIMTLGGMGFRTVNKVFNLGFEKNSLTQVIEKLGNNVIRTKDTIIIPNFHPASYTSPEVQMEIWGKILENLPD
jgi:hypothetical protein